MQKVQVLSQPTEIDTQAAKAESRRLGRSDGKFCSASTISTSACRLCRARSSSTGRLARLWVPNTTSTQGARSNTRARSFCARQPPTAICMPGRAALTGARWLRLPYSRLSAFSRTAQVLKTTRSAVAPTGSSDRT